MMTDPQPNPPPQQASFIHVVGAVLSAFIGLRKKRAADHDPIVIKPAQLIAAGVICALLLIATLVTVIRFIIAR